MSDFRKAGQAIWYDYLRRSFIESGELEDLVKKGLSGVTSNPTIFEKAISGSNDYDKELRDLFEEDMTIREMYDELMLDDIAKTADILRPVYDSLDGRDGYVSIEVDPKLANDSKGMIDEARHFFHKLARPNVMIKIPATDAGFPAIKTLISEGVNVNITLIFSLEQYRKTTEAYISGLEELIRKTSGKDDISHVASVASFFVSRVDTSVDKELEKNPNEKKAELLGKIGIANAKVAYSEFKKIFSGKRWEDLASRGARVQRVLFASTSTKNPEYPDTMYVDNLIGKDTINTLPPQTLKAALDHGKVSNSLESGLGEAQRQVDELAKFGIDFEKITKDLEDEGVEKFDKSIDSLLEKISQKKQKFESEQQYGAPMISEQHRGAVNTSINSLAAENIVHRIWSHDYTVWKPKPEEISNRLAWLEIPELMEESAQRLDNFVGSVKAAGYTHIILLGMGGSSLAPETYAKCFGVKDSNFSFSVIDTTDPGTILAYAKALDLSKTMFIVSSKSGKTVETISLFRFFFDKVVKALGKERAGEHFVAITDGGTNLEEMSDKNHFRAKFLNNPNIGGRYSALSYFGLVPAALVGVDIRRLLDNAMTMAAACEACVKPGDNPGVWLGAVLGSFATHGRNKLTLISSPSISSLCDWIEQLIAESTGKEGKGIIPVVHEKLGSPEVYGSDRLFVSINLLSDSSGEDSLSKLESAGHPVVRLNIMDPYEIGKQFFMWEFATAVAGHMIGINPFDQPNVESAKSLAREIVDSYVEKGTFQPEAPSISGKGISIFGDVSGRNLPDALISFIAGSKRNQSYIALQPYLQRTPETDRVLESIRISLRDKFKLATTLGYGPRFLHSTGQAHKGDNGMGLFVQFTANAKEDIPIPGDRQSVTFGVLLMAAALGDRRALQEGGRKVIRIDLGTVTSQGLNYLASGVAEELLSGEQRKIEAEK